MKIFIRWTLFTLAIALIGLAIAFLILFLGRLYVGLQSPAFVFSVLVLYSVVVTIAAINFATKLEDEAGEEADAGGSLRVPSRHFADREDD